LGADELSVEEQADLEVAESDYLAYTVMYRDITAADPTNDVVLSVSNVAPTIADGSEPMTVRGRTADVCGPDRLYRCWSGDGSASPDSFGITWAERPDLSIVLESRALSVTQLAALADGVTVDGSEVALAIVPADLFHLRFEETARSPRTAPHSPEYGVDYGPIGEDLSDGLPGEGAWFTVTVGGYASDDTVRLRKVWAAGGGSPVDIRGHEATLVEGGIVWEEAPGVGVVVGAGVDVSDADLIEFADSLREATDDEWRSLLEASAERAEEEEDPVDADDDFVPSDDMWDVVPDDAVASQTLSLDVGDTGATAVVDHAIYLTPDDRLCVVKVTLDAGYTTVTDASRPACGPAGAQAVVMRDEAGTPAVVIGLAPGPDVDLRLPNALGLNLFVGPRAGDRYLLSVQPPEGADVASALFYGIDDGVLLETVAVAEMTPG
jgi:hypothetical protein